MTPLQVTSSLMERRLLSAGILLQTELQESWCSQKGRAAGLKTEREKAGNEDEDDDDK